MRKLSFSVIKPKRKPVASITVNLFLNLSMVAVNLYKFRKGPQKLGAPTSVFVPPGKISIGGHA